MLAAPSFWASVTFLWRHLEQMVAARADIHVLQNRCYARLGWTAKSGTFCPGPQDCPYHGFSLLTANQEGALTTQPSFDCAEACRATVAQ